MKLLLLGGPKFVGRAVIDTALERGHEVTLFNRGMTGAELYPGLERIVGDRDGGLEGLRGREWDAVVDTSGYLPRVVGQSAGLLADAVGHYVFVSSISAYASLAEPVDEESPLAELCRLRGRRTSRPTTARSRPCASRRSRPPSRADRRTCAPG